jgi:2-aminoadipate transaminase
MIEAIGRFFPREVSCTRPKGGMFLWVTLPPGISAMDLFELAIQKGVAFVPGRAFVVHGGGENSLRLNFSNCDESRIVEGIQRLAAAMEQMRHH